ARFFVVLGMLAVRTPSMVWLVYPLLFCETIGAAFFQPAHSSVVPNIVPPDRVLSANALASITWSFCLAAGAALGGVVAALLGRLAGPEGAGPPGRAGGAARGWTQAPASGGRTVGPRPGVATAPGPAARPRHVPRALRGSLSIGFARPLRLFAGWWRSSS